MTTNTNNAALDEHQEFNSWFHKSGFTKYMDSMWAAWQARAAIDKGAQQAAPEAPTVPTYQVRFEHAWAWHDASEDAYHTFMPERRRIVYAPPAATMASASTELILPQLPKAECLGMHFGGGECVYGHTDEQVRQAQRDAYELGLKAAGLEGLKPAETRMDAGSQPVVKSGQRIEDDNKFQCLLYHYAHARAKLVHGTPSENEVTAAFRELIAYIDGRTAGTAPEGWKLTPDEPTDQMTYIGQEMRYDPTNSIGSIYCAMLDAAPSIATKETP